MNILFWASISCTVKPAKNGHWFQPPSPISNKNFSAQFFLCWRATESPATHNCSHTLLLYVWYICVFSSVTMIERRQPTCVVDPLIFADLCSGKDTIEDRCSTGCASVHLFYVIYRYVFSKWRSIRPVEINQYDIKMPTHYDITMAVIRIVWGHGLSAHTTDKCPINNWNCYIKFWENGPLNISKNGKWPIPWSGLLQPVLNGISIPRFRMEIPFWALLFLWSHCGHYFFVPWPIMTSQ